VSNSPQQHTSLGTIEQQAAGWVLRCDRGLTPAEQDDFLQWLAAEPRHGAQLARHRSHWTRLDRLADWRPEHSAQPNPDLLAPPLRARLRRFVSVSLSLAAAAAIAVAYFNWWAGPSKPGDDASVATATAPSSDNQRLLADGSIIELNRGAAISVQFTAAERRVRLERGEAYFAVAKDHNRPFIVAAGGIEVRAVGTAFNMRLDAAVVEVLVTEGRVQVNSHKESGLRYEPAVEKPLVPNLEARQRAVVALAPQAKPPQIATLTIGEIDRVLAWQRRLLNFTATPLSEVVAEFNRRNMTQLVVLDPELASVRISAAFHSDNLDGFVRLLEAGFGAQAERRGETEILLRKAPRPQKTK
jgi:transmembrane sensor